MAVHALMNKRSEAYNIFNCQLPVLLCLNLKFITLSRHLMELLLLPKIMGALDSLEHPFLRGSMYVKTFVSVCFKPVSVFIGRYIMRSSLEPYTFFQEGVDALINCVNENIGFSEGKPVAAITIYKCLVHWKVFETEKTSVFDRLIQIFGSAMQVSYALCSICFFLCVLYVFLQGSMFHKLFFSKLYLSKNFVLQRLMLFVFQKHDSNEDLAYWLSNSSTLLIMLQKSLKAAGSTGTSPPKRPQTQSSFLGRMVRFINYSWS